MCRACSAQPRAATLDTMRAGRLGADRVLGRYLGLRRKTKANLATPAAFDAYVGGVASDLRLAAGPGERAAFEAALRVAGFDWTRTTTAQAAVWLDEARVGASDGMKRARDAAVGVIGPAAGEVFESTREHSRAVQRLPIGRELNAMDRRAVEQVTRSQANFISTENGKRLDEMSDSARRIVASGLERGLGREDISAELAEFFESLLVVRPAHYWDVIAAAFVGSSRSYSQLSTYVEADVQRYTLVAVLDEATTEICRLMDGKSFEVSAGLSVVERVLESPEGVKSIAPWVRTGVDEDGKPFLYVKRGDEVERVASVDEPGIGVRDRRGSYSDVLDEDAMARAGVCLPPFHGLCRTTTIADV